MVCPNKLFVGLVEETLTPDEVGFVYAGAGAGGAAGGGGVYVEFSPNGPGILIGAGVDGLAPRGWTGF